MRRLFLVRHGQTDWNVAGRLQGTSDIPLNAHGLSQALATASSLADAVGPQAHVVSSPLRRASATADAIAAALDVDVNLDPRLTERAYGVWEGLVEAERQAAFPAAHAAWRRWGEPDIEGYESHATVVKRMREAVDEWTSQAQSDLVFVTHASSARMAILDLLNLPTNGHPVGSLENAAWSRLTMREPGEWSLDRHNIGATDSQGVH